MKFSVEMTGEFDALVADIKSVESAFRKQAKAFVLDLAEYFQSRVEENLRSQGRGGQPPPLAESTVDFYRRNPEMEHRGIIFDNLVVEYYRDGVKVSVPEELRTIAAVQEFGATVTGSAFGTVFVPGRRFWSASLKETREYGDREWRKAVARIVRGLAS